MQRLRSAQRVMKVNIIGKYLTK